MVDELADWRPAPWLLDKRIARLKRRGIPCMIKVSRPRHAFVYMRLYPDFYFADLGPKPSVDWCRENGYFLHITLCTWRTVRSNPKLRRNVARVRRRWHNAAVEVPIADVFHSGVAAISWRDRLSKHPNVWALRQASSHKHGPLAISMGW